MNGRFIVFEGPEGGGKTEQARRLAASLREAGHRVVLTREPGGTPIGEEVRNLLLHRESYTMLPATEALLMTAARAQHVGTVIDPALRDGSAVVCDRFVDSTLAYQGGGRGLSLDSLRALQLFATVGLEPDLRILLDVPVDVGLVRRMSDRASINRIDEADRSFHERVRQTFLALAAADPERWFVVDAQQPVENVASQILRKVEAVLPRQTVGAVTAAEAMEPLVRKP